MATNLPKVPSPTQPIVMDKKMTDMITEVLSSVQLVPYKKQFDWMEMVKWLLIVVVVGYVLYYAYLWYTKPTTVIVKEENQEERYQRYPRPQDYQYY